MGNKSDINYVVYLPQSYIIMCKLFRYPCNSWLLIIQNKVNTCIY